jgi:hypothetical protein
MKTIFRTQTPRRTDFWALGGFLIVYGLALGTVLFL